MTIKTKIAFNEYLKLMYYLTYRKGWTIYVFILGLLMLVIGILSVLKISDLQSDPTFALFFGAFAVIFRPIAVYFSAKKNFASNKRLQEAITYEFIDGKMIIKGESFSSELGLSETFKIEELKNWFLIYQSKQVANFVSKSNLSDQQLTELRFLFKGLSGVKLKLKR